MSPLTLLNYPLDLELLRKEAAELKKQAIYYVDGRSNHQLDYWKIHRGYGEYGEKIMNDFGLGGKPRFYWLDADSYLPMHVDHNTTCSINFVLSDDPAPVTRGETDYYYSQALLNTSILHSVRNGPVERVLYKISIFDEPYEQVVEKIKYRL